MVSTTFCCNANVNPRPCLDLGLKSVGQQNKVISGIEASSQKATLSLTRWLSVCGQHDHGHGKVTTDTAWLL